MVSLDDDLDCIRGHHLSHVLLCPHLVPVAEDLHYFSSAEVQHEKDFRRVPDYYTAVEVDLDWRLENTGDRSQFDSEALDCTAAAAAAVAAEGHSLGEDRTDHMGVAVGEVDMAVDHSLHCCSTHLKVVHPNKVPETAEHRNSDEKQVDHCYKQAEVLVAGTQDLDKEAGHPQIVAEEDTDLRHCYNLAAVSGVLANTDHRAAPLLANTDPRRAVVHTVGNHHHIHQAAVVHIQKYTHHTYFVVQVALFVHHVVATALAFFHPVEYDYNDGWQIFPLPNLLFHPSCTKIHILGICLPCKQS